MTLLSNCVWRCLELVNNSVHWFWQALRASQCTMRQAMSLRTHHFASVTKCDLVILFGLVREISIFWQSKIFLQAFCVLKSWNRCCCCVQQETSNPTKADPASRLVGQLWTANYEHMCSLAEYGFLWRYNCVYKCSADSVARRYISPLLWIQRKWRREEWASFQGASRRGYYPHNKSTHCLGFFVFPFYTATHYIFACHIRKRLWWHLSLLR